jgi:spore coat protein U-like protein
MANVPLLNATVKITVKDINGNSVAKQFNQVTNLNFDYNDGTVNIIDATGSFNFTLKTETTLTYTIAVGVGGSHVVVMS